MAGLRHGHVLEVCTNAVLVSAILLTRGISEYWYRK